MASLSSSPYLNPGVSPYLEVSRPGFRSSKNRGRIAEERQYARYLSMALDESGATHRQAPILAGNYRRVGVPRKMRGAKLVWTAASRAIDVQEYGQLRQEADALNIQAQAHAQQETYAQEESLDENRRPADARVRAQARVDERRLREAEDAKRDLTDCLQKAEKRVERLEKQLQRVSTQLAQTRSRLATTASERDAALDAAQIAAGEADATRDELERTREELQRLTTTSSGIVSPGSVPEDSSFSGDAQRMLAASQPRLLTNEGCGDDLNESAPLPQAPYEQRAHPAHSPVAVDLGSSEVSTTLPEQAAPSDGFAQQQLAEPPTPKHWATPPSPEPRGTETVSASADDDSTTASPRLMCKIERTGDSGYRVKINMPLSPPATVAETSSDEVGASGEATVGDASTSNPTGVVDHVEGADPSNANQARAASPTRADGVETGEGEGSPSRRGMSMHKKPMRSDAANGVADTAHSPSRTSTSPPPSAGSMYAPEFGTKKKKVKTSPFA